MNEEVEKIITHAFEYAQTLIQDTKEFYPFGAFIDTIGNVHPLEFEYNPKKMPQVGTVIDSLTQYCETEMAAEKMRGYGMVYEAEVQLAEGEPAKTCIALTVKHCEAHDLPQFYQAFEVPTSAYEAPSFEPIFAVK